MSVLPKWPRWGRPLKPLRIKKNTTEQSRWCYVQHHFDAITLLFKLKSVTQKTSHLSQARHHVIVLKWFIDPKILIDRRINDDHPRSSLNVNISIITKSNMSIITKSNITNITKSNITNITKSNITIITKFFKSSNDERMIKWLGK